MQEPHTHSYSMPGMVYTPVEVGTIRLGHLEDRNGKPTPVKDDKFTVTRLVRRRGAWLTHPLQQQLLDKLPPPKPEEGAAERKLREIPIRIMYDSPDLTVRARYEAFDAQRKRPVCASTSTGKARRLTTDTAEEVECLGPENCAFAQGEGIRCKFFGRIMVQIEGQTEADNGFVLRSTSINTLRNFEAKLTRYWALFGKRLTGVPFRLMLRTKTTSSSFWQPFFFCDLELAEGLTLQGAAKLARDHAKANDEAGLDIQAWEAVVRSGLGNGALAAASDIEAELMTEFYSDGGQGDDGASGEDESEPQKGKQAGPALTLDMGRTEKSTRGAAALVAEEAVRSSDNPADPAPSAPVDRTPGHEASPGELKSIAAVGGPMAAAAPKALGARHLPPKAAALAVSQRPPVRQNPPALPQRRQAPTNG